MQQSNLENADEIDIFLLMQYVWGKRWKIAVVTFFAVLVTLISVLLIDNRYKAVVILAPGGDESSGALAGLMGQFGGLANLAGISLGDSSGGTVNALAVLRSEPFINEFIREHNVKLHIFADKWDATTQKWLEPSFLDNAILAIRGVLGKSDESVSEALAPNEPTDFEAYEYFLDKVLDVSEDKKSGLITISVEMKDPDYSVTLLNALVASINFHMRADAKEQSQKSIEFLTKEMESTSLVEVQKSISKLMEAQIKTKMLADANEEFAFKVLARPVKPEKQSFPKRTIILLVIALLTAASSTLFYSFAYVRQSQKN